MTKDQISLAICIDKNFVMQAGVFITSIKETNKDEKILIYIFNQDLSDENKNTLNSIVSGTEISLEFLSPDLSLLPEVSTAGKSHLSMATYYRLLIPYALPESVSKLLYLDCDMIVLDSLRPLWETDINGKSGAVSMDMFNDDPSIATRLMYNPSYGYFNAGMILINLDYWRKNNISGKTLDFLRDHKELCLAHDQDALNHTMTETALFVSVRYNLQLDFLKDFNCLIVDPKHNNEIIEARRNPCIIHYTGPTKPWLSNCDHPYTRHWDYFCSLTIWKNLKKKCEYSGNRKLKYEIKMILKKIHCFKEPKPYLSESINTANTILENLCPAKF